LGKNVRKPQGGFLTHTVCSVDLVQSTGRRRTVWYTYCSFAAI